MSPSAKAVLYEGWITTGRYQRTLTAASGADSIITTSLTVNPVVYVSEDINIIEGERYQGWSETGEYQRTLTSVTGCDSIVNTRLTVRQIQHQSIYLEKGWNIVSSRLVPVNENMEDVLAKLQQEKICWRQFRMKKVIGLKKKKMNGSIVSGNSKVLKGIK